MSELAQFVKFLSHTNVNTHQIFRLKLKNIEEINTLKEINTKYPKLIFETDSFIQQLTELIKAKHPSKSTDQTFIVNELNTITNNTHLYLLGTFVYYPWRNTLILTLDEEDFITVRTTRNKLKITHDEQEKLRHKTIGVVGLSVGQSVALTLAMERLCGTIKIADFDTLDLSNLNRIRSSIFNINVAKTTIAAREILELDPYLNVEVFENGLSTSNMDNFLQNLDLFVEVCDSVSVKLNSRIAAKKMKIPVVMDTNDRGMIDIERFDIEPERPILHGLISNEELERVETLSPLEKIELIKKLVSFENTSERLKQSMGEIGKSISTWPQLASSVMLGAGVCADCCRRILLGEPVPSGRYYIDPSTLIQ